MAKKRKQKQNKKGLKVFLFLTIVFIVGFIFYKNSQNLNGKISSDEARSSLQIDRYSPFYNSPPTNKNPKPIDDSPEDICQTPDKKFIKLPEAGQNCCYRHVFTDYEALCCDAAVDLDHVDVTNPGPEWKEIIGEIPEGAEYWCDAKPIIYLYPQTPTYVSVKVEVPGEVVISDPLYPPGGWEKVLAHPDGNLYYQGQSYKELFYEASITPIDPPKNGVVIPTTLIPETLEKFVTNLGLIGHEKESFLSFWIPKLQDLKTPYIHISAFQNQQKQKIDRVIITPKPDVFIEFIMYFKPLETPISVKPFSFPQVPERKGFTAVEWGGIIDN